MFLHVDNDFHGREIQYGFSTLADQMGIDLNMIETLPQKPLGSPLLYYGESDARLLANAIEGPVLHILPCRGKKHSKHGACEISGFGSVDPLVIFGSTLNAYDTRDVVANKDSEVFAAWVDESVLLCGIDFAYAAHHFLSLDHEAVDPVDFFGRPIGRETSLYLDGLAKVPVVERLAEGFLALCCNVAIRAGVLLVRKAKWPDRYQFCVPLSHDIDVVRKYTARGVAREFLSITGASARKGSKPTIETLVGACSSLVDPNVDPFWNLKEVARLDQSFGARSSFYFLASDRNTVVRKQRIVGSYGRRGGEVFQQVQELSKEGFEIGLHGAYGSHTEETLLCAERDRLQDVVSEPLLGIRQHFLLYDRTVTPLIQAKSRFCYDSSVGYRDFCGYRSGTGCPYTLFETEQPDGGGLIEIPPIIMDSALLLETGSEMESALSTLMALLEACRQDESCLTLLWHNTSFIPNLAVDLSRLYAAALDFACVHGGWLAPLGEVWRWWDRRRRANVGIQLFGAEYSAVVTSDECEMIPVEIFVPSQLFGKITIRSDGGKDIKLAPLDYPRGECSAGRWWRCLF